MDMGSRYTIDEAYIDTDTETHATAMFNISNNHIPHPPMPFPSQRPVVLRVCCVAWSRCVSWALSPRKKYFLHVANVAVELNGYCLSVLFDLG